MPQVAAVVAVLLLLQTAANLPVATSFATPTARFGEPSQSQLHRDIPYCCRQTNIVNSPRHDCDGRRPSLFRLHQSAGQDDTSEAANRGDESPKVVKIGTDEYYDGFLSRSLDGEPAERVTGDALLGPTFKFVSGFVVVIGALLLGFLASNGLL